MNKNIKRLIESLFDDDDILYGDDETGNSDLINTKLNSTDEILKPLLDKIANENINTNLKNILLSSGTLTELSDLSHKNMIEISFVRILIHRVETFKKLFDILYEYNIFIKFGVLEFILENETNKIYSITDLLDLSKYTNFNISEFVVSYGKLQDLKGFPVNIEKNIEFNWISYIGSLQGFPKTKYYIQLIFENSPMPYDWSGCPSILYGIEFKPNIPDADKLESIKNDIGTLYNIPYNLSFENNNPNLLGQQSKSCIISKYWDSDYKKEIKQYIASCLKQQYNKNIMPLTNKLCKQY